MNTHSTTIIIALLACLPLYACTWAKLTPGGETVEIITAEQANDCKKVGRVTNSVKHKVIGVKRASYQVKGELSRLARNSAARMDGDSVIADSEIVEGEQSYIVYRCKE